MNSIHEAIRKFRPDLNIEGVNASARLMPAAAVYPESIKPDMVMRGLAGGEDARPQATPPGAPLISWRPPLSLALAFALAIVIGAGIALRPAKMGAVGATYEPRSVASFNYAVVPPPPGFKFVEPTVAVAKPARAAVSEPAKKSLAPIRKAGEYVSLQPVKTPGKTAALAAAQPAPEYQPDPAPVTAVAQPAINSDMPEVLYESESPQTVPTNVSTAAASVPAAPKQAQRDRPSSASSSPAGAVRIQGIFWDSQRPMALLGDDIVEVGSETPLGKVVEITKKNVVFERNGARVTLAP